jgi:hypothetical protein
MVLLPSYAWRNPIPAAQLRVRAIIENKEISGENDA